MNPGIAMVAIMMLALAPANGQRITTIQLDGVQYFISRMNPYSPELNYFLAYQYCRSLGLQLASFETKEKADSITTYLTNAGYNKYDFWTSGNNLGTDMFLWMSSGLPFNATFNYMRRFGDEVPTQQLAPQEDHNLDSMDPIDLPQGSTAPQRTARHGNTDHIMNNGCVALKAPSFHWEPQHCGQIKDFICEQTRCYYYNYGSIPVSSAQGKPISLTTTTTALPLTSSSPLPPQSEHLPTHFTLNDLLGKLRPSSLDGLHSPHLKAASALNHKSLPQVDTHYSGINHQDHVPGHIGESESESEKEEEVDEEGSSQPTQGPYDQDAPQDMAGDDPNAYAAAADQSDEYVSTVEPDVAVPRKAESVQENGAKFLAPPSH